MDLIVPLVVVIAASAVVAAAWLWHDRRALKRRFAEAEALRLRIQLNPHFLFNTLDAIAGLGFSDPKTAEEALRYLSQLLRRSLTDSQQREITLRDEKIFLEGYLKVQKILLRERLAYQLSFDADVLNALLPSMLVQPLAENALTHGIGKDGVARVVVKAMRGGENLIIAVADAGPGLRSGLETGTGISNIRDRLEYLYGGAAQLKLLEPPGGGLMAQLVIPFHESRASRDMDRRENLLGPR